MFLKNDKHVIYPLTFRSGCIQAGGSGSVTFKLFNKKNQYKI
jgi:hypothetical protein